MLKNSVLASRHNRRLLVRRKSEVLFTYIFLILLMLLASCLSEIFLSPRNLRNLVPANVGILLVTYGQLFMILLGGVDLSVGAVISLVNVICATQMTAEPSSWMLPIIISVLVSLAIGLFNGLLITKGNQQPIIATLATQTLFAGVALWVLDGPGGALPSKLCKFFSKGFDYFVPVAVVLLASLMMWLVLNRSAIGRNILAVGGSAQSAEATGIDVERTKIAACLMCSLMACLGGLYISFYATSGNPIIGESYTQRSITAAVVGGAALAGGKGSVIGCIAAALILGIINNVLNLQGVSSYYQYVMQGAILIAALSLNALKRRK